MKHIGYLVWSDAGLPLVNNLGMWDFYQGDFPDFVSIAQYDYWCEIPSKKEKFLNGKKIKKVFMEEE